MKQNILLTFLSDVKTKGGTAVETPYTNVSGEPVHSTNESAARYLKDNSLEISQIFILASKKIRNPIKDFSETITHLDYFKNRMEKFLPGAGYTICNYDENCKSDENLKSVAEMAELIQKYSRGKEIVLHADLTGGMRHINMMMLDIIRLLEYSGVEIGRIMYSNYNFDDKKGTVEEIQNIYNLFQLISGVEEFINFGSVTALKKYYAEVEISDNLKNLIEAMANFADSIKLCRYGQFKAAIERLHDAINDFEADSKDVQDILMSRLIEKIRAEYSMLIATRGQDDLKIIRWCVERGYLQQALTLYTERIPEYIYEKIITASADVISDVTQKLKNDNRNFGFYFLNNYLEDDEDFIKAHGKFTGTAQKLNNKYFALLKNVTLPVMKDKNFNFDDLREKIFTAENLPFGIKKPNEKQIRLMLETLNKIWQNPEPLLNLESSELLPIQEIINSIKPQLEILQQDFLRRKEMFKYLNGNAFKECFPAYECDVRIFRLKYMLDNKIFGVSISEEKFFDIMKKYFSLKDERNHSNHARLDIGEFETAKDLSDFMKGGLDEIEG